MMIPHGATKFSEWGGSYDEFFKGQVSADFKARFRWCQICDHGALLGYHFMPSQLPNIL